MFREYRHGFIYDFITELCRQQAKIIQNHENVNVSNIGQGEAYKKKKSIRGLTLAAVRLMTAQVTKLPLKT
jgi:hypothetical protein